MVSELSPERILEALRAVEEPELHKDIVSLNMVRDVTVRDGDISLTIMLTTPACPLKTEIERDVRNVLQQLPGVKDIQVKMDATVPKGRGIERGALAGVRNIIAVASGKGGVGKTTVAVNVAVTLGMLGARVGLMDGDVYGPNVPLMMGVNEQPRALGDKIIPLEAYGIKLMSMGFLNPGDKPLIWRGPMLHSVVQQFLRNVDWGDLDYLIIDLPPGTGDVQLTLIQTVPVSGAIIVTTPSTVALADVRKAIEMFRQVNVEVLGVIENMSYFVCPHCSNRIEIFSHGEGKNTAEIFKVPFLGEIEIDPAIRLGGDTGKPVVIAGEDAPQARSFFNAARTVAARISVTNLVQITPVIQIQ